MIKVNILFFFSFKDSLFLLFFFCALMRIRLSATSCKPSKTFFSQISSRCWASTSSAQKLRRTPKKSVRSMYLAFFIKIDLKLVKKMLKRLERVCLSSPIQHFKSFAFKKSSSNEIEHVLRSARNQSGHERGWGHHNSTQATPNRSFLNEDRHQSGIAEQVEASWEGRHTPKHLQRLTPT